MTLYAIKPKFQALLRPLVALLFRCGVTANQVTLLACLISVALGVALALHVEHVWLFWLIPGWMFLRMALNAIDGMLAREFGQKSALGAYLNELTDVIADSALFLPFALLPHFGPHAALSVGIVIVLAVISEMTGTVAVMTGASRRYDGPLGKSDRALVFGAFALAVALGLAPQPWMQWLPWALAALLVLTIINRVRRGLQEIARTP